MILHREISAIILAAGLSRRMGDFKPLIMLGGKTVLERVVSLYVDSGITDIRVVTGHRAPSIQSALAFHPVSTINNAGYASGMFSSIVAGVNTLPKETRAFFVHPVDIPLVRPHSIKMLMAAFNNRPTTVTYPVVDGQRGHPPLIHRDLKRAILSHDGRGGLRVVLDRFDSEASTVHLSDEGMMLDLDTPEDVRSLSTRLTRADCLTENECRLLMENVHQLPDTVVAHCRAVASVAVALAEAVNEGSTAVDIPLVRSAALVHDLAKGEENHADTGANLLKKMGFPAMAAIVATHMELDVSDDSPLDGAQIVHLADKLVIGDGVVNLSQRFDAKLKKYGSNPKVAEKINQRQHKTLEIRNKIEQAAGCPISTILDRAGLNKGRRP